MRFLVDESAGGAVAARLRELGHDVVEVAKAMPRAEDPSVLERAARERRVLLTNDKDFGELSFRSGQAHAGIVLLRLDDERSANRARVVQDVLERWADQLEGAFTVVTETGVRIRRAPQD